jgi:uncharacterized protein
MVRAVATWLVVGALGVSLLAAFPTPHGPVNDFAGVLDDAAKAELTSLVRSAREQTTTEIAVVTVPSLDGMSVEEYANKLFAAWGIGKQGANNGVLLLVAPSERTMRIEVGYGLEPILPDGLAGDIIRTDCLPQFRAGHYSLGILAGTRHVAAIVARGHALTPAERRALTASAQSRAPAFITIPFFAVFVAIGWFAVGLALRTRTFAPLVFGAMFGLTGSLMSLIPAFNAAPLLQIPLALIMLLLGYRKGGSTKWISQLRGAAGTSGAATTGWVMGASSGGGDSGSSGGGGGFGGGSSGGGGASGSW